MNESTKPTIGENVKGFLESPLFGSILSKTLVVIGGILVVACIFLVGESVGYHKAEFSGNLGENYNRIFQGPHNGNPLPMDNMFSGDHGAVGNIVKISLPHIVIADADGTEKIVVLENNTLIKEFRNTLMATDLQVGDSVTVLGVPQSNGEIQAELVRRVSESTATSTSVQ